MTLMCCLPVSWAVYGLCGGATVDASAGLQHQNSGHQVRMHAAHSLLSFLSSLSHLPRVGKMVALWLDLEERRPHTNTHHTPPRNAFVVYLLASGLLSLFFSSLACFFVF